MLPNSFSIFFSPGVGDGKTVLAGVVVSHVLLEGDLPGVRVRRSHLQERLRHAQEDLQQRSVSKEFLNKMFLNSDKSMCDLIRC